jgi:chorismate lyase / 3-hydroxybenzoate synthase
MSLPPTTTFAPSTTPACRVTFGHATAEIGRGTEASALRVALPVLAGAATENVLEGAQLVPAREGFTLFASKGHLAGFAVARPALDLETAALELYRQLFAVTQGLHLHRIWNYVPQINAPTAGLENYRHFCRGRSLAFEHHFGRDFEQRLPAASGVGAMRGPLALAFLAGESAPTHFENPRQVPAFHYPREYGPRAPSFSRATLVRSAQGERQLFISGTAAIRGHASIAVGDQVGQLDCTVENLRTIGETAGIGSDLAAATDATRHFKVYIRRAADLDRVQAHLDRSLLRAGDTVSYLHADLCRADLLVEIEGVVEL